MDIYKKMLHFLFLVHMLIFNYFIMYLIISWYTDLLYAVQYFILRVCFTFEFLILFQRAFVCYFTSFFIILHEKVKFMIYFYIFIAIFHEVFNHVKSLHNFQPKHCIYFIFFYEKEKLNINNLLLNETLKPYIFWFPDAWKTSTYITSNLKVFKGNNKSHLALDLKRPPFLFGRPSLFLSSKDGLERGNDC